MTCVASTEISCSVSCPRPAPYVDATVGMDLRATVERSLYDMDNQDAQWLARVRSMDMKGEVCPHGRCGVEVK